MRRRIMILAGVVTVALLGVVAALPVAAHMGGGFGGHAFDQSDGPTVTIAEARANFDRYLQQQGYDNLAISEVMQFSNQFYAEAVNAKTGAGALELVMSLDGEVVTPEPGPMMMWNTAYSPMLGSQGPGFRQGMSGYGMMNGSGYGMMGDADDAHGPGMMGGSGIWGDTPASPDGVADAGSCAGSEAVGYHPDTATQIDQPLNAESAQARVQNWLDQNRPGITAADATAFPGYFTFHTERDGKIIGMLSIQTSTGAIWEHVWHGEFVAMDPAS